MTDHDSRAQHLRACDDLACLDAAREAIWRAFLGGVDAYLAARSTHRVIEAVRGCADDARSCSTSRPRN